MTFDAPPVHVFDVEAHRGGAGLWPENTLEAFGRALAIGVSTLELDVHLTAEDDVVVHHDPTVHGGLADARRIRELTRADLPPTMPLLRGRRAPARISRQPGQPPTRQERLPDMTTSRRAASRATLVATAALGLAAALSPAIPATSATSVGTDAAATSSRGAPTTVLDVRGLEQGDPPAVRWSERRAGRTVIHGTGGATTPAPNRLDQFAPMGSGYVIQTIGAGGSTTRWLGADGTSGERSWRTGYGLAVSARGKAVAFSGRGGRVWSIDESGDRVLRFNPVPITGRGRAVALFGEDCKESSTSNGCAVYVNGPHRAYYTSSHGIVDRVPRLRLTSTGRGRWVGGITSLSDTGSCSAMLRSWKVRWRTCDNQLSDISPDNRHVLGTPAYADGFGPGALDVLSTADGSVVRSFTSARNGRSATYFDEVWEDPGHVLVVTYQADRWAVVRLGVDGSMEYAVAPRRGTMDVRAPFQLQTR